MSTLSKRTGESILFDFEFSTRMAEGDTLASLDSVTQTLEDGSVTTDLTIDGFVASGTRGQARIAGGTDQVCYYLVAEGTTARGDTIQVTGRLELSDTVK